MAPYIVVRMGTSGKLVINVGWDKFALERWPTIIDVSLRNGGPAPKAACPTLQSLLSKGS